MLLFKLATSLILTWTIAVSAVPADNKLPHSEGGGGEITPEMVRKWKEQVQHMADEAFEACMDRELAAREQDEVKLARRISPSKRSEMHWYYLANEPNKIEEWAEICSREVYVDRLLQPSEECKTAVMNRLANLARSKTIKNARIQAKTKAIEDARARDATADRIKVWVPRYSEGKGRQSNAFSDLKTNIKGLGMNAMRAIRRVQSEPFAGFRGAGFGFQGVPGRFGFAP